MKAQMTWIGPQPANSGMLELQEDPVAITTLSVWGPSLTDNQNSGRRLLFQDLQGTQSEDMGELRWVSDNSRMALLPLT